MHRTKLCLAACWLAHTVCNSTDGIQLMLIQLVVIQLVLRALVICNAANEYVDCQSAALLPAGV